MADTPVWGSGWTRRRYLRALAAAGTVGVAGCRSAQAPAIEVPDEARLDEVTPPVVTGLSADRVTLTAETTASVGGTVVDWRSEATFDVEGDEVDPAKRAPVDGDYDEPDPMGPFWAMETDRQPATVVFPPQTHDVSLSVAESGAETPVAEATTRRVLPTVEREPLGEELVGTVHLPGTDGPAPGVVLLHGSGGRVLTRRARLLAGHGFVAATLKYFGTEAELPDHLVEVPVEYVERAVEEVAAHDRVSGQQVGVYGVSKGAELALLVGSLSDGVGAVVSIVGSGLVWPGARGLDVADTSSWSHDGEPVPYVPIPRDRYDPTGGRPTFAAGFEGASREEIRDATIPVERIDGPVLLVSGGDDGIWNSVKYSDVAVERPKTGDHPHRVEHLVYENAGHLIGPPYLPTYGLSRTGPARLGGTPAGNAEAAAGHWPKVVSLLSGSLGQ